MEDYYGLPKLVVKSHQEDNLVVLLMPWTQLVIYEGIDDDANMVVISLEKLESHSPVRNHVPLDAILGSWCRNSIHIVADVEALAMDHGELDSSQISTMTSSQLLS